MWQGSARYLLNVTLQFVYLWVSFVLTIIHRQVALRVIFSCLNIYLAHLQENNQFHI